MPGRQLRKGSLVGGVLFASVLLAVTAAGCEIAIGNDVAAFECVQEAAVCPDDQICDPNSHQCVAPCSVTGCGPHDQCDPVSNVCVPASPADDGPSADDTTSNEAGGDADADADATTVPDEAAPPVETGPGPDTGTCKGTTCPCNGPSSCDSGICADSAIVPAGLYTAAGGNFCTKPCCSSAECDAGTVCFAPGGSSSVTASYCVNPAWLQRSTTLGTALGGATCSAGRDCRSGLCAGTTCADTCCSTAAAASECAAGNECRFGTFQGTASFDKNYVAYCGHGGTRSNGQSCQANSDCQSELCDGVNCSNACRNTGECSAAGEACAYVSLQNAPTGTVVAACFSGPPTPGNAAQGSSCSADADCQSIFCSPTSKECTDVCFANSDCTKAGWRCRPESFQVQNGGSFWVLACGP
jgi:hypothetical protein